MNKEERKAERKNEIDSLIARSPLAKSPFAKGVFANAFPEQNAAADPDREEPKAAAPKAERKKAKLEDLYSLHTYWIRKDLITKIRDYAYTERRSVRQAINKIIDIAFDQIEKEYQAKGKNLEHYEGDEEL